MPAAEQILFIQYFAGSGASASVIRVDRYIIIGEVAAPCGRLLFSHVHIRCDDHLLAGEQLSGLLFAVVRGASVCEYQELPFVNIRSCSSPSPKYRSQFSGSNRTPE